MITTQDKVISFIYTLYINGFEGETIETVTEQEPLSILLGKGSLLPAFEEKLVPLQPGETFKFSLSAEEAYGSYREDALITLPLEAFKVDGKIDEKLLQPGNVVPMVDSHGHRMNGTVLTLEAETVRMDFNHPLAGRDLYFTGSVLEMRDATEDELAASHHHSHEGCGCGGDCGCDGNKEQCDGENCQDENCSCQH